MAAMPTVPTGHAQTDPGVSPAVDVTKGMMEVPWETITAITQERKQAAVDSKDLELPGYGKAPPLRSCIRSRARAPALPSSDPYMTLMQGPGLEDAAQISQDAMDTRAIPQQEALVTSVPLVPPSNFMPPLQQELQLAPSQPPHIGLQHLPPPPCLTQPQQAMDALVAWQPPLDQTFRMNSLTSPVLSHCSTPQTSLIAPVAHGVAEQMAWELQEEQKEQQALAEAAQVDAIPQLQVETEPYVKQYMSQPEHSARPTRRIIRTQAPSQHEGSMKGSAPGEGQALAKTPKADEESHKLRTKVEEDLAAPTEATSPVV